MRACITPRPIARRESASRSPQPRRSLVALPTLLLWLATAPAALAAGNAATVEIQNFTFTPAELTVKAGTTVTWVNHDDIPHLVAATDKSFRSPPLDTDEQFSFTFEKPGKLPYFCALHPRMTGTIVVTKRK
ncbi:cupredoxin domain-containing protein [Kaistia sp. MMO-174]|uniref:cupredoxin domain-containing protein n=1 Tax=Kaistia sp. MMO-174 TaxID=3081256 RepID=UPI00301A8DF2